MRRLWYAVWFTLGLQFEDLARFMLGMKPLRVWSRPKLIFVVRWNQICPKLFREWWSAE